MPSISVFIPLYNRVAFIAETIESALRQTTLPDEVLVVDDGSTDGSPEIVERFQSRGVRLVRKPHTGAPETRNLGVAEANGDYVVTVGSDDVMLPHCIEALLEGYKERPELDLYYGDLIATDENLKPTRRIRYPQWEARFDPLSSALYFTNQIGDGFAMARRSWVLERGGYSSAFSRCQDWDLWARSRERFSLYHVGSDLGYWRWHGNNLSANRSSHSRTSFDRAIRERILSRTPAQAHMDRLGCAELSLEDRPIRIWGAGEYGSGALELLAESGAKVQGFIDSDATKWGQSYRGLKVDGPEALFSDGSDTVTLIASVYEGEIAQALEDRGLVEGQSFFRIHGVEYCRFRQERLT
ncbi:MAG: hypothetical protein CBD18_05380 [Opitutales bacterium TMED158]|nr:MAG: hypothetical protein CBD18_05380 [Opitutales bacterium TMED158]